MSQTKTTQTVTRLKGKNTISKDELLKTAKEAYDYVCSQLGNIIAKSNAQTRLLEKLRKQKKELEQQIRDLENENHYYKQISNENSQLLEADKEIAQQFKFNKNELLKKATKSQKQWEKEIFAEYDVSLSDSESSQSN